MKDDSPKGKQLLLGIKLALALSITTFARSNGQSWSNSLILGGGTFGIASTITGRRRKHEETFQPSEASQNREEADQIHRNAVLAWEKGDIGRAIEAATTLKDKHFYYFNNSNACFLLAGLLRSKKQYKEAHPYFERYAEIYPDSELALSSLAESLIDIGQFEKAVELFTRVLETNAEDSRILFNRGVAYCKLDNISCAHKDWKAALEMGNEEARKLVEFYDSYIAEEVSVSNYRRLIELGKNLKSETNLVESNASFTKAINVGVQLLESTIDVDLATAYKERGTNQYSIGNYSEAVEDYERAEKRAGTSLPEIAAIHADALSSLKRNADAIGYYDLAISWNSNQLLHFERALAKTNVNDSIGAIADYTTSIDLNTDQGITWKSYVNRGCLKAHKGELLDAEKDFLAGLELNASDTIAREWLARTYSETKRYGQAFDELTRILEIDDTYWEAYRLRGMLSLSRYEYKSALDDLKKYAENCDGNEEVQENIRYTEEKLNTLVDEDELLESSDNLEEWRKNHALLSRNAAYIQRYENYLAVLAPGEACEMFRELISRLQAEYLDQVCVSAKYKDAYYLFRLRNLTYAIMAVNMNGEQLEDREAFDRYFSHPVFDEADTVLRKTIRGDKIETQIEKANILEQYMVYGCSIYCNRLLNLIDGGRREELDKGENYDKFLEIQSLIEAKKMVDEIYVVREAMIWTIASSSLDLVTSAEESDAFEIKAFDLLSKTNIFGYDYGNGPYRREDILRALCQRWEWGCQLALNKESISSSKYLEKLLVMTDEQISVEAIGTDSSLDMRKFLNRWGQASRVYYGIDHLRQAVINDYAYLCYQDGGTQPDEISLEDFKKNVKAMSLGELISETSVIETSEFRIDEIIEYIEFWIKKSEYASYNY